MTDNAPLMAALHERLSALDKTKLYDALAIAHDLCRLFDRADLEQVQHFVKLEARAWGFMIAETRPSSGSQASVAKGLTLDNMEAMADGLRIASEPARRSKKNRDAARFDKMREKRARSQA